MPSLTIHLKEIHRSKTGKDGRRFSILNGVSLRIDPGSVVGIFGHSGSGKSTLLRMMNRLEDPDQGTICYGDIDTLTMNPIVLRRKISMVLQKPIMFPVTIADNIMLSDTMTGLGNGNREKVQSLIEAMRLPADILDRNATELSVGQQARVQLARILYMGSEVIMLDETTAHLDMTVSTWILDELEVWARNNQNTIIHVSHEKLKLQRSDRIFVLNEGRIVATGTPDEILNNEKVASVMPRRWSD